MSLILMLALWPFHTKAKINNTATVDGCDKSGKLYFYMGEDGLINFSPASCDAAKHNWSVMHIDPVRMSRS